MDRDLFEKIVSEAFDELPESFRERLDNVVVVVEEWPDRATLRTTGARSPYNLLGFYHGVPLSVRTSGYGLVPPDKISIYRRPIEARCRNTDQVRELVGRVLRHEIAHHFGIGDDRLHQIGAY